jgi:hypothetical protein
VFFPRSGTLLFLGDRLLAQIYSPLTRVLGGGVPSVYVAERRFSVFELALQLIFMTL